MPLAGCVFTTMVLVSATKTTPATVSLRLLSRVIAEAAIALLGLTLLASVCPQSGRGTMSRSRPPRGAANASSATTQPTHTRKRLTTSPASVRLRSSQTFDICGASLVLRGCGVACRQSHSRAGRRRVVDGCAWQERWLQDDRLGAADHRQQSPLQVSTRRLLSERSRAQRPSACWPPVWPVVRPQVGQFARQMHRVDGGWRRR